MSYDLMVFDPATPPRDPRGFMAWYERLTEWSERHSYDDPEIVTAGVRHWFLEIVQHYPALNGPHAAADVDHPKLTDYTIGTTAVYAAFSWSEAEAARRTVFSLARKHRIGFFDASAKTGGVWLPSPDGGYELAHGGTTPEDSPVIASPWKFSCESRSRIPLPPEYSFAQAFNYLSSNNSLYVLEHENGDYIQCGGGREACTVEMRVYKGPDDYKHYVVGCRDGVTTSATVTVSGSDMKRERREVLDRWDAIDLFKAFFAREEVPDGYCLREFNL